MSAQQQSLADFDGGADTDVSPDRLRDLYERHDGNMAAMARELPIFRTNVRELLEEYGIGDDLGYGSRPLFHMWPHQVDGLSPLNCGECGAEDIYEHPCPACGYDPGDVGGEDGD